MVEYDKIALFIFGVLSHATIWSDASIDKLSLDNMHFSHWETNGKKYDDKMCMRKCKYRQKPRQCHYEFAVEATASEDKKIGLTINGLSPGPMIRACLDDIIIVEVTNRLPGQELAFHWHGIDQRGTPYMDGVPMVTQCPINSGTKFKYAFRAGVAGTYFYHAHSVVHHSDGLFGGIVISEPEKPNSICHLYDVDKNYEHTYLISADFPVTFTNNYDDLRQVKPNHLLINGDRQNRIFVEDGLRYRLRFINAVALECQICIVIEGHEIQVITVDGRQVKPTKTRSFCLNSGERVDFVLKANLGAGNYRMSATGVAGVCNHLEQRSQIIYNGLNQTLIEPHLSHTLKVLLPQDATNGQSMISATPAPSLSPEADVRAVLAVDSNEISVSDDDSDYRYLSDALPVPPFYPAQLSKNDGSAKVVQINGKNFMYPSAPILTAPSSIPIRLICPIGYEDINKNLECLQTINLQINQTLELIVIDKGLGSDISRTFHMHGNSMFVLATRKSSGKPLTVEEVQQLDRDGQIKRNLINPPRKDTISVPNKGFVVVRIIADNPGSWLFECRSCSLSSLPAAILIIVPIQIPKIVIDSLPKCSSFRPPDILLN